MEGNFFGGVLCACLCMYNCDHQDSLTELVPQNRPNPLKINRVIRQDEPYQL